MSQATDPTAAAPTDVPAGPAAGTASDETLITEITIQPDGRVYVFGTSREILEVLAELRPDDPKVCRLLGRIRTLDGNETRAAVG